MPHYRVLQWDKQNELPKRDGPTCIRGGNGQVLKARRRFNARFQFPLWGRVSEAHKLRSNTFPFGVSPPHQRVSRAYLIRPRGLIHRVTGLRHAPYRRLGSCQCLPHQSRWRWAARRRRRGRSKPTSGAASSVTQFMCCGFCRRA
jgi:hypothetical protein